MSSPVHHADTIDPALIYAPPRVRDGVRAAGREGAREGAREEARAVTPALRRFSGDDAMLRLQRQLALDPDAVPEPPAADQARQAASDAARMLWPMALRLAAVAAVAALVAWGIVLLPAPKKPGAIAATANGSANGPADLPANMPPTQVAAKPIKLVHVEFAATAPLPGMLIGTDEPPTAVPPPAAAPSSPVPQPASPPRDDGFSPPDAGEVETLVKRGKDFLVNGDLASARLLLKRAAEAGSAEAALALGASFDPEVVKRLGAVGAAADIDRARQWYRKAAQLGSAAASQQLAKLAPPP